MRIGLVGCGGIAGTHLDCYSRNPRTKVVAVADISREKAEALALLRRLKDAGILNVDWARRDPDLACLHRDPDFLALIGSAPVA